MYLIAYLDRGIISVAQPEMRAAFGLSLGQMGLVLAAFTWAYAVGQVPVGWLGDRFGPKKVLTVLIAWTSTSAILTGAATGLTSLFAARLLLGIGEAGAFPVASRGMQLWLRRPSGDVFRGRRISSAALPWRSRRSPPGACCSRTAGGTCFSASARWDFSGSSLFRVLP